MRPIPTKRSASSTDNPRSGKDTLLGLARDRFGGDRNIVFPRRIVTREPSAAEANEGTSETDFAAAVAAGGFAFWWDAHGLKYALGAAVDDDIRAGKVAVCNVSRAVVAELRRRYADVRVVLVTAPADVLAARLAARGRATDGAIGERLGRLAPAQNDYRDVGHRIVRDEEKSECSKYRTEFCADYEKHGGRGAD